MGKFTDVKAKVRQVGVSPERTEVGNSAFGKGEEIPPIIEKASERELA